MITPTLTVEAVKRRIDNASAVIFDNDGTLVDSMPVHMVAWQKALAQHGLTFSEHQFYAMAGMPASEIIPQLATEQRVPNVSIQSVIDARKLMLASQLQKVRPVAVVIELLHYARQKGLPIAVASGGETEDVLATLKYCDIDISRFGAIVTADDVKHGKPHPETFLTAAERLGVEPSGCIGLEDGEKGLDALRNAGMEDIDVRKIEGYPLPSCLRRAPNNFS
ncbi:Fructose-1-phosphate phosphatase YqaB [Gracilariopsis chorda]|uniref:Fructose-1-phosphate phosphatase YqaB n=1 Tax=Gracilariopsis chorda TaxID=448386 RepID=A0A2V3J7G0_9FLOR|nr:Fructose-1-phosphate phosphatase YqaB [Gracilariopsis chorda]|eukprot:PXF49877.1 Fructose-1-phosphate phosphatase YqaB [Gracilariopsis chorda]